MVLWLDLGYFQSKFGVNILERWRSEWEAYARDGYVELPSGETVFGSRIRLTMDGLLRVDGLLPVFFEPQFRNVRYT